MEELKERSIKTIIGLGNPGSRFERNRHNIGFRVVDALAQKYSAQWKPKGEMLYTKIFLNGDTVMLVKPQTYMNSSGRILPLLQKDGVKAENILVVHDELEKPFGKCSFKIGGSHRGHNGLRSLIGVGGADFSRLRFGVGRPENKEDVPDYVLSNFTGPEESEVEQLIEQAVVMIEDLFNGDEHVE